MNYVTKRQIAERFGVSLRSVDNWVARGELARPVKLGTAAQARVRWPADAVAAFEQRLRVPAA
jgi:predicted DNA-binding transcriptional regulator AlpA